MRTWILIVIVLLCSACQNAAAEKLRLGKATYAVEVMQTPEARQQGLMGHAPLAAGQGMLFIFDTEGVYPFWMKNMAFAIDMIWIGADQRVVYIAANVPPCKVDPCAVYTPAHAAKYVLEVPAGDAFRQEIKAGSLLFRP
jgi:uncharacterized membrane protein (UPF0127 family)